MRLLSWPDAQICRCASVGNPYIYALACMSPTLEAIVNLACRCYREHAERLGALAAGGLMAVVGAPIGLFCVLVRFADSEADCAPRSASACCCRRRLSNRAVS